MQISIEEVSRLLSVPTPGRSTVTLANSNANTNPSDRNVQSREAAQVDVSAAAQEVLRIKKQISQLPDVRADRVLALKAQVENGTYHVSGADIADSIIRRTLADSTAL